MGKWPCSRGHLVWIAPQHGTLAYKSAPRADFRCSSALVGGKGKVRHDGGRQKPDTVRKTRGLFARSRLQ
ncbi:hypothetical protein J6590_061878 [Homalodisca vitripennis]|nr:hypothetical protein J6590_061878 [Homalodisca vitripennis]